MITVTILQNDYTSLSVDYQLKLPLELEKTIPADDPVRLLSAFVEGMDLSELYGTYQRIRKNQATPEQLLKIVLYAAMNRIYSSRDIESSCRRDINFMYLLEGMPAPDHSTIARFLSIHLSRCSKKLMAQVTAALKGLGEITGEAVFIDGTKIESCANKYTFVWKKAVTKNMQKMFGKIIGLVCECESDYGIRAVHQDRVTPHTLIRLREELARIRNEEGILFVHGIGHRKPKLQKQAEKLDEFIRRLEDYQHKLEVCGDRNSYSKTDPDATFMRMKEDAMRNGQLKPAYNVQHAVDSGYIVWTAAYPRPTDTLTLIPLIKEMEEELPFRYHDIVADAGYESEENYLFLRENGQDAYIKPNNYEISKKRKYRKDPGRMENMTYLEDEDAYLCKDGRKLVPQGVRKRKTASEYQREVTIYSGNCNGCPYKTQCIHGNNCRTPMEQRNKTLYVSKKMKQERAECLKRITSEYGTMLRMNRSIQAEGSFASVKADMNFRRYLYRGKANVVAESIILAIAHNIRTLHHRIQSGRTGHHLYELKGA